MKQTASTGRSTVWPCLMVADIGEEMEFLGAVFGAEVRQHQHDAAGSAWQVEARWGTTPLLIGRTDKAGMPPGGMLYVWTESVEATLARAMAHGATLLSAPADQPSGVREAGFRDPQGITWWIGQQSRKPSSREVERRLADQRKSRL